MREGSLSRVRTLPTGQHHLPEPCNGTEDCCFRGEIKSRTESARPPEPKGTMKRIIMEVCVFIGTCLRVSAVSISQEPLHYRLASDPAIHGKGKDGECMDYAVALSSKLAANGIHGRLIFYRWHIRDTGITGSHVFVVYNLPDKSEWIVDNENDHPREVPADASPMQLVYLLSNARPAPVDVELQEGLNHLSFF